MERRKFTREFKLEAVRLIKDRGVSYVQASQELGVHTSQLRDWVKKLAAAGCGACGRSSQDRLRRGPGSPSSPTTWGRPLVGW